MPQLVIAAASVRLYVNNTIYPVTQSVSINQDTGEYAIFGINSPYPQEIAGGGQNVVKGSATLIRTHNSGGIQAVNLRPLFSDIVSSEYVSLRLEDRQTSETLWSVPKAKITSVSETVAAKGTYHISISWTAQMMFWTLDLT
jgi:hypothetical protein